MTFKRIRQSAKRWLAIVLAMLTIVVGVLWADSYRVRDDEDRILSTPRSILGVRFSNIKKSQLTREAGIEIECRWGKKYNVIVTRMNYGRASVALWKQVDVEKEITSIDFDFLGIEYIRYFWESCALDDYSSPFDINGVLFRVVAVPFWLLFLLTSVYPVIYFIRGPFRRHRRKRKGHCIDCGYDLRASVETCPECGATIATPTQA